MNCPRRGSTVNALHYANERFTGESRFVTGSIGVYLVAFGGGLASFASPCILPLVPAYLAVIGGLGADRARESEGSERSHGVALIDTSLFVAGFAVVFTLLGMTASGVGGALGRHQLILSRVSGFAMVLFALYLVGTLVLQRPALYGEYRFHPRLASFGRAGAMVAGAAFAFGWTPCVGPVLASVLAIAAQQSHVWRGGSLLLAYSAGLGLPFLAAAVAFDRVRGVFTWLRRHATLVTSVSAASLGVLGLLLALDRLAWVTTQVQRVL
jgi:cytochrome c-type biogenesis protein